MKLLRGGRWFTLRMRKQVENSMQKKTFELLIPQISSLLSLISSTQDIFPKAIFQGTIYQVATSQVCNFLSGNLPKVRLGPLRRRRLQWGSSAAARMGWGGRALRLGLTWKVAAWEIAHLGSFHLGKYPWEVEKVPNILLIR